MTTEDMNLERRWKQREAALDAITEGLAASYPCGECGGYIRAELWKRNMIHPDEWEATCPDCGAEIGDVPQ